MADDLPVFGRPSPAAAARAPLRPYGDAGSAAYRAEGGDTGWCAARMASVSGVRHRLAGEAGQDSFAWGVADDAVVLVVCDGLGAVPDSGAAAARVAAAAARAAAPGGLLPTAEARLEAALTAAEAAAGGGGATTLLLAVVERGGRGRLARVGDSTAFVVRGGGASWREVFRPPDDERDVVATAALPGETQVEQARVELGPHDVLVLATDGVADPWRDGPETVAPALAAAVAAQPAPLELARLAGFSRQGCHDDRTLVVFWLAPDPAPHGG